MIETKSATVSKVTLLNSKTLNKIIYPHSIVVSNVLNRDLLLLVTTVYSVPLSSQLLLFFAVPLDKYILVR